ncbi:MAG: sortase domain-bontaining protein, partial [Micromonosporaceae bacterium]
MPGGRATRRGPARGVDRGSAAPVGVVLLLIGVFATGVGLGQVTHLPGLPGFGAGRGGESQRGVPARIAVAAIGVDARVVGVGTAADGSIEAPRDPQSTGWFRSSAVPGGTGTTVIVGHVDTRTAPAVFRRLAELRPGARIDVTRRDRSVAVFTVATVERQAKSNFPGARIFQAAAKPRLVLVTCGGAWT